jgi:hypothetical protein
VEDEGRRERTRRVLVTALIGAAALGAWFVMLWYMFGDVL